MTTITCDDLMTARPTVCSARTAVIDAAQLMRDEDLGWLPVVDDGRRRKLLGVVTDRDLLIRVMADGLDPGGIAVEEVMTRRPVACRSGDTIAAALEAMASHQVRRVPVVDEGRLVGVVSQADIALYLRDAERTAEMLRRISRATISHPSMSVRW